MDATKRILIADDMLYLHRLYEIALRRLPVRCYFAGDGQEALRLAARIAPDLVLMDYNMPRMNGEESALAIRRLSECAKTPIIAVSGDVPEKVRKLRGFDGHLFKPVRPQQLLCVISHWLGLPEFRPAECNWEFCRARNEANCPRPGLPKTEDPEPRKACLPGGGVKLASHH